MVLPHLALLVLALLNRALSLPLQHLLREPEARDCNKRKKDFLDILVHGHELVEEQHGQERCAVREVKLGLQLEHPLVDSGSRILGDIILLVLGLRDRVINVRDVFVDVRQQ